MDHPAAMSTIAWDPQDLSHSGQDSLVPSLTQQRREASGSAVKVRLAAAGCARDGLRRNPAKRLSRQGKDHRGLQRKRRLQAAEASLMSHGPNNSHHLDRARQVLPERQQQGCSRSFQPQVWNCSGLKCSRPRPPERPRQLTACVLVQPQSGSHQQRR